VAHKLLLADDSVTIQKVIQLTFADEDIEVVAVSDGRQAIELAPVERPDIVLADVGMPERDGYEVAAFIKGHPDLAHIPVLLLTGAFEPIDEGRAKLAGCDGVLVKPFEPQMVINRVKDLIAGKRPMAAAAGQPAAPAPAAAASVPADEYFSRLDAVFPEREAHAFTKAPARPAMAVAPGFADAPVESRASTPGVAAAPAPGVAAIDRTPAPPATPAAAPVRPSAPVPTLAEAFAALLAAEQGRVAPPPPINDQALRDDVVEQVTRRVIERMTDSAVGEVVLEVAERLVREEIARIKGPGRP
jgi:CheY-like chemotaxis protein